MVKRYEQLPEGYVQYNDWSTEEMKPKPLLERSDHDDMN